MKITINVNEYVSVKLNDRGHAILRENYDHLWRGRSPYPYNPPKEDAEGYSRWSVWHLMQEFGPHMYLGMTVPFDTDIVYEHTSNG